MPTGASKRGMSFPHNDAVRTESAAGWQFPQIHAEASQAGGLLLYTRLRPNRRGPTSRCTPHGRLGATPCLHACFPRVPLKKAGSLRHELSSPPIRASCGGASPRRRYLQPRRPRSPILPQAAKRYRPSSQRWPRSCRLVRDRCSEQARYRRW